MPRSLEPETNVPGESEFTPVDTSAENPLFCLKDRRLLLVDYQL